MSLLAQFLLRLVFGLAFGMAITSSKQVTSGYFRNHLYVTLGLSTLAVLVLTKVSTAAAALAAITAVVSFLGAAFWLYESARAGKVAIWLVAACGFAATLVPQLQNTTSTTDRLWTALATTTSGLTLGLVFASMLLGHWYLNAPGRWNRPPRPVLVGLDRHVDPEPRDERQQQPDQSLVGDDHHRAEPGPRRGASIEMREAV